MTLYEKQEKRERNWLDKLMVGVVVIIAGVVVLLSAHNTATLAEELKLNPILTVGLVEILFGTLLGIRARQRATQRNVPLFIHVGFYASFIFVTLVNMYGLSKESPIIGSIVGLSISGAMWLMESVLVWLWTESDKPHKKTVRELMREAKREIKEEKAIQYIEWMKWEAKKPDLDLIRKARRAEEKRKKVIGDGLPEFFLREPEPIERIEAEAKVITVQPEETETEQTADIVPIKRQIGFRMDPEPTQPPNRKPAPRFQPNLEARAKAIQVAKELKAELGRMPKKSELMKRGLTDHYSRIALEALKEE